MITDLKWYSDNSKPTKAIVCLPGRGGNGEDIAKQYNHVLKLKKKGVAVFGLTPVPSWYPPPNGPNDQADALKGLHSAAGVIGAALMGIKHDHGIQSHCVVLAGFSAGAVVALQYGLNSSTVLGDQPVYGVVVHSGAILDPTSVPQAGKNPLRIMTTHGKRDSVFTWGQRYLPMKEALISKGYSPEWNEYEDDGHDLADGNIATTLSGFMSDFLEVPRREPC